jgi:hypothetical protein
MQVKHTKRIVSNLTNDFNGIAIRLNLLMMTNPSSAR